VTRVLCLDVGEKRIGVAVSDLLGLTAQGVETIFTQGADRDVDRVLDLARTYDTRKVLCGLPRNMDGSEGFQARAVRSFAEKLEGAGLSVRFQDERLTSVSAARVLREGGVRGDRRKKVLDKLAATYILQSFLDAGGWQEKNRKEPKQMDSKERSGANPIVELIDEDGQTVRFEHVYTVPYEGDEYVLLSPLDEVEGVEEDEVVILRIEPGEDEDAYVGIEDEELLDAVFDRYMKMAEEEDEEEDEDE
jgi:putative Holliday junction resolvase